MERARAIICAAIVTIAALPVLAFGPKQNGLPWPGLEQDRPQPFSQSGPQQSKDSRPTVDPLAAYRGVAAWIDIYNRRPWSHPERAIRRMTARGVRTLFLQTGNYTSRRAVYRPGATGRFLIAAHKRGVKVISWYLPGFRQMKMDIKRTLAAVRFRGPNGERFDSFALDIESPIVDDIARRNKRLLWLSKRLRRAVGDSYPVGAIVPDGTSTYWPHFPYKRVAKRYDVFLPMAYFTFRTHGRQRVNRYITQNIRKIRRMTSDRKVPIHVIGGIAGDTSKPDMRGFVSSIRKHRAVGASLYDFPITKRHEWRQLRRIPARPISSGPELKG
jgi:hypothetical protein